LWCARINTLAGLVRLFGNRLLDNIKSEDGVTAMGQCGPYWTRGPASKQTIK
jgi:hypothetical protein